MGSKKEVVYTISGYVFAALITVILLLLTPCSTLERNGSTLILNRFSDSYEELLSRSTNSAPIFCTPDKALWFVGLLPFLCSLPYISRLAAELNGNHRFHLVREKCFSRYWNRTFYRYILSGAGSVTAGYMIFCTAIYLHFPKNSEFLTDYPKDSYEEVFLKRQALYSPLGDLFNSQNEYLYIFNAIINVFIYSAAVSAFCLLLYLLLKNKYKALGLPMVALFLLDNGLYGLYLQHHTKIGIFCPSMELFNIQTAFNDFSKINQLVWLYYAAILLLLALIYLLGGKIFRKRVMN